MKTQTWNVSSNTQSKRKKGREWRRQNKEQCLFRRKICGSKSQSIGSFMCCCFQIIKRRCVITWSCKSGWCDTASENLLYWYSWTCTCYCNSADYVVWKLDECRIWKAYLLQTSLNKATSEIIATYVYEQGLWRQCTVFQQQLDYLILLLI